MPEPTAGRGAKYQGRGWRHDGPLPCSRNQRLLQNLARGESSLGPHLEPCTLLRGARPWWVSRRLAYHTAKSHLQTFSVPMIYTEYIYILYDTCACSGTAISRSGDPLLPAVLRESSGVSVMLALPTPGTMHACAVAWYSTTNPQSYGFAMMCTSQNSTINNNYRCTTERCLVNRTNKPFPVGRVRVGSATDDGGGATGATMRRCAIFRGEFHPVWRFM